MEVRKFVAILGAVSSLLAGIGIIYNMTIYKNSEKGHQEVMQQNQIEQSDVDLKRDRERRKMIAIVAASGTPIPASLIPPPERTPNSVASSGNVPTPENCLGVADTAGKTRSTAVVVPYGQCVTFQAHDARKHFYMVLGGAPQAIAGSDASFGHLREETLEDKANRRTDCMRNTNDADYCDAEVKKPFGVRVDDCVTKDSPDRCLGYLKGKTGIPIAVSTGGSVNINLR